MPPLTHQPDPRIISLDLETFGKVLRDDKGPLPPQTQFHPRKMIWNDGVAPDRLVQSASITLPEFDPRCPNPPIPSCNSGPSPWRSTGWLPLPPNAQTRSSPPDRTGSSPEPTCKGSPPSSTGWSLDSLAQLRPGPTIYLPLTGPDGPRNKLILAAWLEYADTLLGMNLQFDLLCLRNDPDYRYILRPFRHTILELSAFNYQHSELRVERSLKDVGPVTRLFTYDENEKQVRYPDCYDPAHANYNSSDTHNAMLGVAYFARRIREDWPHTDKFSPYAIAYYSDLIWACITMAEQGIPMSRNRLSRLEGHLLRRSDRIRTDLSINHGLQMDGEGSQKAKSAFFESLIKAVDEGGLYSRHTSIRSNRLLQITPKKKTISHSEENRTLLSSYLPPSHPLKVVCGKMDTFGRFQKLVSAYTYPLLRHSRKDTTKRQSALIPPSRLCAYAPPHAVTLQSMPSASPSPGLSSASLPDASFMNLPAGSWPCDFPIWFGHPSWFPVPSAFKDSGGSEGGTIQCRITCKDPAAQTFPPPIQRAIMSRYLDAGCIVNNDLEQIELKGAALLSGDESLCGEYALKKPDLHGKRAIQVFGPDVVNQPGWRSGDMRVDARQWAKQLNFADLFLASPFRMQRTISELSGRLFPIGFFEEIERSRSTIRAGLVRWQYSILCHAEAHGHLCLPYTGHTRHFDGFRLDHKHYESTGMLRPLSTGGRGDDGSAESLMNEIVNFPVQSMAGITMQRIQSVHLRLLPPLDTSGVRIHPFLNVYDALKFDCHRDELPLLRQTFEQAVEIVRKSDYWAMLESLFNRRVPLTYGSTIK
jgi:hypothetical protein